MNSCCSLRRIFTNCRYCSALIVTIKRRTSTLEYTAKKYFFSSSGGNPLSILPFRNVCDIVYDTRATKVDFLHQYGFSEENISNLISNCPDINKLPEENLKTNFTMLYNFQFAEHQLVSLIINQPYLLFANRKQLKQLYIYLISNFTKGDVYKLFYNNSTLAMDSISMIEQKLLYLEGEMFVKPLQIVNSRALGYPLNFIKERHEFLIRVGVYKIPDEKKVIVNPKLDAIFSTSDEEFATKTAGVSLIEYEVFRQMFITEE